MVKSDYLRGFSLLRSQQKEGIQEGAWVEWGCCGKAAPFVVKIVVLRPAYYVGKPP